MWRPTSTTPLGRQWPFLPFAHAKYQDNETQQDDWVGTLRGRLGIVTVGKALFYATGGLAYGAVQHSYPDFTN